jgi:hypothetical protein
VGLPVNRPSVVALIAVVPGRAIGDRPRQLQQDGVDQVSQGAGTVEPGTLMHKAIPPRMVEPYLTGRRSIISGFVHRVADTRASTPGELLDAFALGYPGSEFSPDMTEIYVLRWRAVSSERFLVPYSPEHGGDWAMPPPFTGTGFTGSPSRAVAEYFTDPIPVPVGAEIHCISIDKSDFIARYDGQVWLRPAEGSELCATG